MTPNVTPSEKMSEGYEKDDGRGRTNSGGEYVGVPSPCGSVGKAEGGEEGGGRKSDIPKSHNLVVKSGAIYSHRELLISDAFDKKGLPVKEGRNEP
jgi:hypothetical protein